MDQKKLDTLKQSLTAHHDLLGTFLKAPDMAETNLYLPIAAQLRVLLCDRDVPILLEYARAQKTTLSVWAPIPLPDCVLENLIMHYTRTIASWSPRSPRTEKVSVEDFLDLPVGYHPPTYEMKSPDAKPDAKPISPRQLIKWVANKDGVCHLDFKKPRVYETLKSWTSGSEHRTIDNALVRGHIIDLGVWTYHAISEVLTSTSDASLIVRAQLKKTLTDEVPIFEASAPSNGLVLSCSAMPQHFEFRVWHGTAKVDVFQARYPDDWKIGTDVVFALVYKAADASVELHVNEHISHETPSYILSDIANGKGRFAPGHGEYFAGNTAVFCRAITQNEIAHIRSLPLDWIDEFVRTSQSDTPEA